MFKVKEKKNHLNLLKQTDPIIIKGPKQSKSNKIGNSKFPITAPIRPMIIVTLRAIVL